MIHLLIHLQSRQCDRRSYRHRYLPHVHPLNQLYNQQSNRHLNPQLVLPQNLQINPPHNPLLILLQFHHVDLPPSRPLLLLLNPHQSLSVVPVIYQVPPPLHSLPACLLLDRLQHQICQRLLPLNHYLHVVPHSLPPHYPPHHLLQSLHINHLLNPLLNHRHIHHHNHHRIHPLNLPPNLLLNPPFDPLPSRPFVHLLYQQQNLLLVLLPNPQVVQVPPPIFLLSNQLNHSPLIRLHPCHLPDQPEIRQQNQRPDRL